MDLALQLNEEGSFAFWVIENGAVAPSHADVLGVFDDNGASAPPSVIAGVAAIGTRNAEVTVLVSGLRASTAYIVYIVARDDHSTPNVNAAMQEAGFTTAEDMTPPTFVSGWPAATVLAERSASVGVKISEAGKVYAVVLPRDHALPSAADLKARASGDTEALPAALGQKKGTVAGPADQVTVAASGLVEDTVYHAWFYAEDVAGNHAAPVKFAFTTLPDTTVPQFAVGYPALWNLSDYGFTVEVRLNEGGRFFMVVLATGSTPPTAAQVKAGEADDPVLATATATVGSSGDSGLGVVSSGVQPTTTYDVWIVGEDDELTPNEMASPTKLEVTTQTDATPPNWVGTAAVFDVEDFAVSFRASIDEPGTVFYVVWPAAEAAPAAQQVRKREGPSGQPSAMSGQMTVAVAEAVASSTLAGSGLEAATDYVLYAAAEDDEGQLSNLQLDVLALPFSTLPDATPPKFPGGMPRVRAVKDFEFVLEAAADEPCTVFFAVLVAGGSAPTPAQVVGGQFGVTAVTGSMAIETPGAVTVLAVNEGVQHSTVYDMYLVAEDTVGPNRQATVTHLSFTTEADASPPTWVLEPEVSTAEDFRIVVQFKLDEASAV